MTTNRRAAEKGKDSFTHAWVLHKLKAECDLRSLCGNLRPASIMKPSSMPQDTDFIKNMIPRISQADCAVPIVCRCW